MESIIICRYYLEFSNGILIPVGEYEFASGYDADEVFALFYVAKIHDPKKAWFKFIEQGGRLWGSVDYGEKELLASKTPAGIEGKYWTLRYFGLVKDDYAA